MIYRDLEEMRRTNIVKNLYNIAKSNGFNFMSEDRGIWLDVHVWANDFNKHFRYRWEYIGISTYNELDYMLREVRGNLIDNSLVEYCRADVEATKGLLNSVYGKPAFRGKEPSIKDGIFNGPATIVLWQDGTKTIVKAQNGEPVDKEKGLAMAIVKKVYGNKGNYNDIFRKYIDTPAISHKKSNNEEAKN